MYWLIVGDSLKLFLNLGPEFGSPPLSLMRKKLLTVLSECGKSSSFIDDISTVKRYASGSSHAIPVSSDDEALSRATKEVGMVYGCAFLFYLCLFFLLFLLNLLFILTIGKVLYCFIY